MGIKIDKNLTWKQQIKHVGIKQNKASAMLYKSNMFWIEKLWGQSIVQFLNPIDVMLLFFGNKTLIQWKISSIAEKSSQNNPFSWQKYGTGPLFRAFNIRNYFDKNALGNCIFVSQSLKGLLLSVCSSLFKFAFESHSHDTRWENLA